MLARVIVKGVVVVASLAVVCFARAMPQETSYHSTSVFSIPSSHQSVMTVSESRVHHGVHVEHKEPPKPYKFEYKVHDDKSHNYQQRAESSDGHVVRGFYSLLEPHGEVRVVKYRADHDGFQSEVSRHGGKSGDSTHGGGLGANLGEGASELVSHHTSHQTHHVPHHVPQHGLSSSSSSSSLVISAAKDSIPIHEDHEEGHNQWAAIDDPSKRQPLLRGQAQDVSGSSKRIPEQILLQQQKKAALQQQQLHKHQSHQAQHIKQGPPHKFAKRPLGPPLPHGPPRQPPRHGPFPRGVKGGPGKRGPAPRGRPLHGPHGPGPHGPGPQLRRDVGATAARREARPQLPGPVPASPCQCADPLHAQYHTQP